MKCIICGAKVQNWDIAQGGIGSDCAECSRYDISGTVLELRAKGHHRFDVEQTRHWLVGQREAHPDEVPMIKSGNERWAL
ncbi:hypothetical protein [Pseudomonas sp. RA_35y_Pfl2_P32]|uniref:hypothetical protein n=1 Tax=Pseudomonas sp. RA_35y_Pfl2_P32 TaxID=3088705 RepID=UPI0030D828B3